MHGFVLKFMGFVFQPSLFAFTYWSRKGDACEVSKRDTWINCNSCFILTFGIYIHESCEFVQFRLNSTDFFVLRLVSVAGRLTSVKGKPGEGSGGGVLDSLFCFLTLVWIRKQSGKLVFETGNGLGICAGVFFLLFDHEKQEVLFCFLTDLVEGN